jgi:hypothetical protein
LHAGQIVSGARHRRSCSGRVSACHDIMDAANGCNSRRAQASRAAHQIRLVNFV